MVLVPVTVSTLERGRGRGHRTQKQPLVTQSWANLVLLSGMEEALKRLSRRNFRTQERREIEAHPPFLFLVILSF